MVGRGRRRIRGIEASKKKGTNWDQYDVVRAFDEPTPVANWAKLESQIYNMDSVHLYHPTPEQLLDALRTGEKIQRGHQPGVAVSTEAKPGDHCACGTATWEKRPIEKGAGPVAVDEELKKA
jgi:hypothetical protein